MSVARTESTTATDLVRWFDQISMADVAIVGGKNASLGETYRQLTPRGVRVPNGFATTADAYRMFLQESGLDSSRQTATAGEGQSPRWRSER